MAQSPTKFSLPHLFTQQLTHLCGLPSLFRGGCHPAVPFPLTLLFPLWPLLFPHCYHPHVPSDLSYQPQGSPDPWSSSSEEEHISHWNIGLQSHTFLVSSPDFPPCLQVYCLFLSGSCLKESLTCELASGEMHLGQSLSLSFSTWIRNARTEGKSLDY